MGVRKIFLIPRFDFLSRLTRFYINGIRNFFWCLELARKRSASRQAEAIFHNNLNHIKSTFCSPYLYVGRFFCNNRNYIKTRFLRYLIIYWQYPRPLKKISYELIQAYPSIPVILRAKPYSVFANDTRGRKPVNSHGGGRRQARRANYKKSLKGI